MKPFKIEDAYRNKDAIFDELVESGELTWIQEFDLEMASGEYEFTQAIYAVFGLCVMLGLLMEHAVRDVDIPAGFEADFSGCANITSLPDVSLVEHLKIQNCISITELSELPDCDTLDVSGCTSLTALPPLPECRSLDASGCVELTELPHAPKLAELRIDGCVKLTNLNGLAGVLRRTELQDEYIITK